MQKHYCVNDNEKYLIFFFGGFSVSNETCRTEQNRLQSSFCVWTSPFLWGLRLLVINHRCAALRNYFRSLFMVRWIDCFNNREYYNNNTHFARPTLQHPCPCPTIRSVLILSQHHSMLRITNRSLCFSRLNFTLYTPPPHTLFTV